jgi:hypothetical protein
MTENDLADHDLKALRECIEIQKKREPDRVEQIESMLRERSWLEAAQFACYSVQMDVLRLKPWESPPCSSSGDEAAQKLLWKMLKAGVSEFDPDPLAALPAVAKRRRPKSRDESPDRG